MDLGFGEAISIAAAIQGAESVEEAITVGLGTHIKNRLAEKLKRKATENLDNFLFDHNVKRQRRSGSFIDLAMGKTRKPRTARRKTKKGKRANKKRKSSRKSPRSTPYDKTTVARMVSFHRVTLNPAASGAPAHVVVTPNDMLDPIIDSQGQNSTVIDELRARWWDKYAAIYDRFEPLSAIVDFEILANNVTTNVLYGTLNSSTNLSATDSTALRVVNDYPILRTNYGSKFKYKIVTNSSGGQNSNHIHARARINFKKIQGFKRSSEGLETEFVGKTDVGTSSLTQPTKQPRINLIVGALDDTTDLAAMTCMVKITVLVRWSGRKTPVAVAAP